MTGGGEAHGPLESLVTLLVESDCFGRDIRKKGLFFFTKRLNSSSNIGPPKLICSNE